MIAKAETEELERVAGIEPAYEAWKATALPLSYTRSRGPHAIGDGQRSTLLAKLVGK